MLYIKRSTRRVAPRGSRHALSAAAVVTVALLTGCGGSDSSDSPSAKPAASAAPAAAAAKVSPARLQTTIDEALTTKGVKASSLPPLMRDSLERAAVDLTPAQIAKAYDCWKATSCTFGDGDVTIAQADAFGGNTWRQFTKMSVILEALTHPEVGKFVYTDAKFDLATYQANLRTLVAQGADAIVTNDEFGPAAYSALAAAEKQGVKVVNYVGAMEDAPPASYTTRVQYDLCATGKDMARVTQEATSAKGPVAFLEGLAGNPQDEKTRGCVEDSGVPVAFKDATDYTPAGTQKAASALIASGKPVKAILSSYANTVPSIVAAYRKAGKDVPTIITLTQSNQAACEREKEPYPLYVTSSANWAARIATNAAVKAAAGEKVPEAVVFPFPLTKSGPANCDAQKPAEYPGPSLVPDALVDKMLASK